MYPILLVPAATQNDGNPVPTLASEDAGEDVQHYGSDSRSRPQLQSGGARGKGEDQVLLLVSHKLENSPAAGAEAHLQSTHFLASPHCTFLLLLENSDPG